MYKVSVIIPIYNVEDYIVRCAESLFNQTLDDMQFIFVDDASPDRSIALLEQTIERFPQRKAQTLILHHAENKGLPLTRATGLARVEAPYVAHCDSDDYVEPDMYAKLYEKALQDDSDMVICGRVMHWPNGKKLLAFDEPEPEYDMIHNYLYRRFTPVVWARLTRTDIYRRVQFPVESYLEDWVQTAQTLTYAARISFLKEYLYHYQHSPMSLTSDNTPDAETKMQKSLINYKMGHDFIMEHHKIEERVFLLRKVTVRSVLISQMTNRRIWRKYLQTFPEINFSLLFDRRVSTHTKLVHLMVLSGLYPFGRSVIDFARKAFLKCLGAHKIPLPLPADEGQIICKKAGGMIGRAEG